MACNVGPGNGVLLDARAYVHVTVRDGVPFGEILKVLVGAGLSSHALLLDAEPTGEFSGAFEHGVVGRICWVNLLHRGSGRLGSDKKSDRCWG